MFQKNIGTNLVTSMVDTNWYRYDINYFDYSSNWHTPPPQLPTIITVTITINTAFAITTIHPNQHPTKNDYLYLKTNKFRLKKCNHKMNFLHIKLDISITLFFYHYHCHNFPSHYSSIMFTTFYKGFYDQLKIFYKDWPHFTCNQTPK